MLTSLPRRVLLVPQVGIVETRLLRVLSALRANSVDHRVMYVSLARKALTVLLGRPHVLSAAPARWRVVTMIGASLVPRGGT